MAGLYSYVLKSEVVTGGDMNVISLTKKLNLFQKISLINAKNVRIKNLRISYLPRTGTLGTGKITATVRDNRIDGDMGSQVINELTFSAEDAMVANWCSCIWLPKSEFTSNRDPPITFEMELTECNMMAGCSIGFIVIVVDITASDSMDRFIYKQPTAQILDNPALKGGALKGSRSFRITDKTGTKAVEEASFVIPGPAPMNINKRALAGVAREHLKGGK
ncbi:putative movement protein [Plumbago necrotic spot associated virus]|nr:putative movement protein [Plumbago necrotic spot associated virus]